MPLDRFNNLPQEEGRLLASVGGAFRLDRFTISLEGQNLLDKRDAVDAIGFPLAPARVFVSASASFGGKR